MGNRLQNILTFTNIASGATSAQLHLLQVNGVALVPDYVEFDNPSFDLSACTSTTLTIINRGGATGTSNVRVVYDHSIERAFNNIATTQLSPAPFVVRGAAISGGFEAVCASLIKTNLDQIVTSGGTVALTFNVVAYDTSGGTVADLPNNRFVIPVTGIYLVTANLLWNEKNAGSGSLELFTMLNGSAGDRRIALPVTTAWNNASVGTAIAISAAVGNFVTFQVFQDTSVDQNARTSQVTIQRVG